MLELSLDGVRAKFRGALSYADDERFLVMIWALNALQTGRSDAAINRFRGVPEGAATEGILGPHAIYPWELETLANELFSTQKAAYYRFFDVYGWNAITSLVNLLRNVENAEYGERRDEVDILNELGRISARQFEWQRGFNTTAEFYRSIFIYGQGSCAEYFSDTHGVSIADMAFVGFSLMALYQQSSGIRPNGDLSALHELGIKLDTIKLVLARISMPLSNMAPVACDLRREGAAIAYKPSVLRQFPCVACGPRGQRLRAPLPDLIINRVTSGLFYDVIGGGGSVRADYGRRFETYAHRLFSEMLPGLPFDREWQYRAAGVNFDTPDLIASSPDGGVRLVIECKASRMGAGARFAEDPSGERGYEEMAKGVLQVWRFFSHCRRGLTGRSAQPEAIGLVLALDDWFTARASMINQILERARVMSEKPGSGIVEDDRRPVAFAAISDVESMLRTANAQSFLATAALSAEPDRRGWLFSSLHQEAGKPEVARRPYPFDDELAELLPWWRLIKDNRPSSG